MFKMTGIELELISNTEMHLSTEKGIRDSISYIGKRQSNANNKFMECYDSSVMKLNTLLILMQIIYMVGQ